MTTASSVQSLYWASPIGLLRISATDRGIREVRFVSIKEKDTTAQASSPLLKQCLRQMQEYFAGTRTQFDLPVDADGTAFRKSVWKTLQSIPHGTTVTYGDLARALKSGPRAIGGAVGANPIGVLVPCHRVVAASGEGGFAWGIEKKRWLLEHEKAGK